MQLIITKIKKVELINEDDIVIKITKCNDEVHEFNILCRCKFKNYNLKGLLEYLAQKVKKDIINMFEIERNIEKYKLYSDI